MTYLNSFSVIGFIVLQKIVLITDFATFYLLLSDVYSLGYKVKLCLSTFHMVKICNLEKKLIKIKILPLQDATLLFNAFSSMLNM